MVLNTPSIMMLDDENYTFEKKIILPTSLFFKRYLIGFLCTATISYCFFTFVLGTFEPFNFVVFGIAIALFSVGYFLDMYSYISTKRLAIKSNELIIINNKDEEYTDLVITHDTNIVRIKSNSNKKIEVFFKKSDNKEICELIFEKMNINPKWFYSSVFLSHLWQIMGAVMQSLEVIMILGTASTVLSWIFWG